MSADPRISPTPTEEEAVAIAASLQLLVESGTPVDKSVDVQRWRWSGRWWSKPQAMRRDRPW